MAGVKGRSGGARPGAGRKKKPATPLVPVKPAAVKVSAKPAVKAAKAKAPAPAPTPAPAATPAPVPAALVGIGQEGFDPRPALEQIALGLLEVSAQQFKALTALLPYVHTKKGEGGKKEQKQADAEKVASRFAPSAPPRLVAAGGRKV